ncbi:IMv membrane protein [Cetacean poxvirus 1]|nr:IMv membrane protein [Cetacean poxvirus 1]
MSYLSYYSGFDEFYGGAGIRDKDLFTEEEKQAFLPKDDPGIVPSNIINPFIGIFIYNDVRTLIGLILFVLAITSSPIIAIIMIAIASIILPFPALVVAYCVSMQIIHLNSSSTLLMAIICTVVAIIIMAITRSSKTYTIVSYIILGCLFCIYIFKLTGIKDITTTKPIKTTGYGFMPSFSEDI